MPRDASATKEKILDAAQQVVIGRGFASASVDAIQKKAAISRGTFFYHFPSKDDLMRALMVRYAETDRQVMDEFMERARKLARDPLEQLLVFVGLYEEMFEEIADYEPGCLFASYTYEAGLFDEATHVLILKAMDDWKKEVGEMIAEAIRHHSPSVSVDPYELADYGHGAVQGAFILSRIRGDKDLMRRHLALFRTHLELLFELVPTSP